MTPSSPAALSGLKVVEFGSYAAGPAVGKHLADHGAQVIKVESRTRLDGFRTTLPPFKDNIPGVERAGLFALVNSGKLGVTLNLKTPGGVELARRLVRQAEVVIENFTPGTMARLGLGYEQLTAINRSLVMLSSCNQGQTGPYAQHPGFGTHLTSQCGFTHLTGWPDREPSLLYGPYIDYIAVGFGVIAVLAALDRRRRTGQGCYIDLSQFEAGLQFVTPTLFDYFLNGRVAQRAGNRDAAAVPHGVYPCRGAERWCALSVHDDAEWERFGEALGGPAWATRPELATAAGRRSAEAELDARIAVWTRTLSREEVVACLRRAEVHVAPVNSMADLYSDPQLQARQLWRRVDHAEIGPHHAEGPPFLLSETPAAVRAAAPLLGEHTEHVFRNLVGLDAAEYAAMEADGVFQ
jgi:crotonobetainyl-CoA:carnitine CoA-transferase CaiB-like acyl-CoA transferase